MFLCPQSAPDGRKVNGLLVWLYLQWGSEKGNADEPDSGAMHPWL